MTSYRVESPVEVVLSDSNKEHFYVFGDKVVVYNKTLTIYDAGEEVFTLHFDWHNPQEIYSANSKELRIDTEHFIFHADLLEVSKD